VRIIAGEFRGRVLLGPEGEQTRPVTDRAKQSIFDTLGDAFAETKVFDVFSGTGSFGLEALSRGASHAVFFESHRPTVARLRQNIATLKVEDRATIVTSDAFRWQSAEVKVAGLISLDPPYRFVREQPQQLRQLAQKLAPLLATDGVLIFRRDPADRLELPGLKVRESKLYGQMEVEFYSLL